MDVSFKSVDKTTLWGTVAKSKILKTVVNSAWLLSNLILQQYSFHVQYVFQLFECVAWSATSCRSMFSKATGVGILPCRANRIADLIISLQKSIVPFSCLLHWPRLRLVSTNFKRRRNFPTFSASYVNNYFLRVTNFPHLINYGQPSCHPFIYNFIHHCQHFHQVHKLTFYNSKTKNVDWEVSQRQHSILFIKEMREIRSGEKFPQCTLNTKTVDWLETKTHSVDERVFRCSVVF